MARRSLVKSGLPFTVLAALLCDDVRKEVSGKDILVGVYGGDVVAATFPVVLVLAVWVQIISTKTGAQQFEVKLESDRGAKFAEGKLEFLVADRDQPFSFTMPPFPMQMQRPGKIHLSLKGDGFDWTPIRIFQVASVPISTNTGGEQDG